MGLRKGTWVSGVAALGPLLLPIGTWSLGVTPKVDFPSRFRQLLPVASRQLPDMYPALAARYRPRDDRGRESFRNALKNSRGERGFLKKSGLVSVHIYLFSEILGSYIFILEYS